MADNDIAPVDGFLKSQPALTTERGGCLGNKSAALYIYIYIYVHCRYLVGVKVPVRSSISSSYRTAIE